jgi:hypothetical protein
MLGTFQGEGPGGIKRKDKGPFWYGKETSGSDIVPQQQGTRWVIRVKEE